MKETLIEQVTEANAYRLNDTYSIFTDEPFAFVCVEHNKEEAEAVARYMTERGQGRKHVVQFNQPSVVAAARTFRPQPIRYKFRATALKEMGVSL